jgi:outer membrane protein assembly factor BamB
VYTGEGVLAALDMAQGRVQWKHQPVLSLGGKPAEYGMACSPLVVGELVVVHVGAPEATVAAFDRQTGELRWKAGSNSPAGYSSPTMLNVAGKATVVAYCGDALLGLDPETGVIRWQYPYVTDYACNIAVPLEINGQVLISSGESHGSTLLQVKDALVTPVWESLGAGSVLRNEWQTSLLVQGQLYGFDNVGSAGPVTNFTCVNAATGKPAWLQRRFGKGNAIAADGKLWLTTMDGELVLLKANPQKFEELARAQVLQTTRQAPSLANGRLYLRDGAEILCLDVRQK